MRKILIMVMCLGLLAIGSTAFTEDSHNDLEAYCHSLRSTSYPDPDHQRVCVFWELKALELFISNYLEPNEDKNEESIEVKIIYECMTKWEVHGYGEWAHNFTMVLECCVDKFDAITIDDHLMEFKSIVNKMIGVNGTMYLGNGIMNVRVTSDFFRMGPTEQWRLAKKLHDIWIKIYGREPVFINLVSYNGEFLISHP